MSVPVHAAAAFPQPLDQYPAMPDASLLALLAERVSQVPFNAVATAIFTLAVVHTFVAHRFTALAHDLQEAHDRQRRADGLPREPKVVAELLHFLGEVEVIFGIWAVALLAIITAWFDWSTARDYVTTSVDYTEAMFVVIIMAIASTRPVVQVAERLLGLVAALGQGRPAAWWFAILTVGPALGSFITEPAAMTICALLLGRRFFVFHPSERLKYATLGLLFVNISIGGTLTHFAAPPVLIVARPFEWDLAFMASHFGWKALLAAFGSAVLYRLVFARELDALASRPATADEDAARDDSAGRLPLVQAPPAWIIAVHLAFLAWTVAQSHYPVLFIGGFLFFLGFMKATAVYQSPLDLRAPFLVGFFLAGLVTHGGLQGWWIAPVLERLTETPLFISATLLTAFNDNALITYLATLVPDLDASLRYAVVAGAVTGGGLTVIANAPNPAGQALLAGYFEDGVSPFRLLSAAALPTIVAAATFLLL